MVKQKTMTNTPYSPKSSRRNLLKFIASSPLIGSSIMSSLTSSAMAVDNPALLMADIESLIKTPDEAINLFDFERIASQTIPTSHYGFLTTGVDDNITKYKNHEAYKKYYLRARRLIDVSHVDTGIELFGVHYKSPIFLSPVAAHRAFHSEGELATAKAARKLDFPMFLSSVTSTAVEEVNKTLGKPVLYQLYATSDWDKTKKIIRRVESAGCKVMALTVDLPVFSNRETQARLFRQDKRDCGTCHKGPDEDIKLKPMFSNLELSGMADITPPTLTWDYVKRLRDETDMKLLLKGIVTHEDAQQCLDVGMDGLIVSNHGGRSEESGRGTIDSLVEIMPVIGEKIPVLIDGGVRRGTDVFKALALGASAVGIGRPYIWGLGSFGEPGVEKVLSLLHKELEMSMKLSGTINIDNILPTYVGTHHSS